MMKCKQFFLFVMMMMMTNSVVAYDFIYDNLCYEFSSSDNVYVVGCYATGAVTIPEYAIYYINGKTDNPKSCKVISIGQSAFSRKSITSVSIPNSVTSIGYNAFGNCYSLKSVIMSNNVTDISENAFVNCINLESVDLPNSVTSIERGAFGGCSKLTSINIPSSVISIERGAFSYCSGLTSIKVDTKNTYYDSRDNCNAIIEKASNTLLVGCKNTIIPNNVTSIGCYAFSSCNGLSSIAIPNSVTSIEEAAFSGCSSLNSIAISNSVNFIGFRAFEDCSNLVSIELPKNLASISQNLFQNCTNLKSVTIPNNITSIGDYAFRNCYALTSIVIPRGITFIGTEAFCDCNKLSAVKSEIEEPFRFNTDAFLNISSSCILTVPNGTKATYIEKGWKTSVFKGGIVEAVPNITFADANVEAICVANWDTNGDGGLSEAEAAAVTDLGTVFKNNKQITSFDELQYFTGLTSIGTGAFYLCNGLRSVIIPNNVTSIDQYGFCDCSSLTSVTFSNNVTSIGDRAFQGCSGLTTISIPNSVTSIGYAAFSGCSSLTTVSIPNNVTSIVTETFDGCSGLTSVSIPNGVTSIGNSAFRDCSGLTSVTIPNSVTSIIGSYAFKNCTNLTSVISEIEEPSDFNIYAFQNISSTCTLTVPYGTKDAYFDKGWSESVFKGGIVELDNRNEQSMELASLPAKTYGDAAYTLPATTTQGLALTWSSGNTNVATISGNTLTVKGAGTAAITASQAGNEEYKPFSKEFTLTVAKAPLTITVNDATKNVGDANPAFTASYEGFVGDDDASVLTAQPTFTTEANENSPVGTYAIVVSGAEAANYEINYVNGTLTVVDEWSKNNTLAITDTQVLCGRQVVLSVSMNNTEDITALQFDLTLPAGVSIATNSKGKYIVAKTERCADHTLSASKPGEANVYKVLLYSTEVESITGNEGAVINVTLEAAEDMEAGEYEVRISNINLTTTAEKKITPADATCVLTVRNSIPGDANGDGTIDVTDIVGIANSILGRASESFDAVAADVNGDGSVDVTDIVVTANIILHDGGANAANVRGAMQMLDPQ